jgi:hypothetical protein
MKMEYKILKDFKKGILLTRGAEIVQGELLVTFSGAPEGAVAIFENRSTGDALYRRLEDNTCSVPEAFLRGEIGVSVTVMDGKTASPVYVCTEIKAELIEGAVLVTPNDEDLARALGEVLTEMQTMKDELKKANDKCSELEIKLNKLIEGYDII